MNEARVDITFTKDDQKSSTLTSYLERILLTQLYLSDSRKVLRACQIKKSLSITNSDTNYSKSPNSPFELEPPASQQVTANRGSEDRYRTI